MSLQDLASLSGIPGLGLAVHAIFTFYQSIDSIKVYKDQSRRLYNRCAELLLALHHNNEGIFGTEYQSALDEAEAMFQGIAKKVETWSKWGITKSLTHQGEIRQGLDEMNRDITQFATRLHLISDVEQISRATRLEQTIDRHHTELEERLQQVLARTQDIHKILSQPAETISDHMLTIQEALHSNITGPEALQSLQQTLYNIHHTTEILPPMADLTGEVRRISDHPVDISGGFSDVYLGEWLGNEKVALKLTRGINQTPKAQQRFMKEVKIWRQLQHRNVARLYGVATLGSHIYAVSPWMEHRNALTYIANTPNANRLKILAGISTGLDFLHRHGVVHGDLRAANILISESEVACITDFGLSAIIEEEAIDDPSSNSSLDVPGNSRWMAPELINPELIGLQVVKRNKQTDIWSYGMLCLEIFTGQRPFANRPHGPAVISDLITGVRPTRPPAEVTRQGLSDAMWELMQQCWHQNPGLRPSMSEIVGKMQTFLAARDSAAPTSSVHVSSPIPIPKPQGTVDNYGSAPPFITPPTSSRFTTLTSSPTNYSDAPRSSQGFHSPAAHLSRVGPRIKTSPTLPPLPANHPKSASIDVARPRQKTANPSSRPSTAPNQISSGAPQLPHIGELHGGPVEEGFTDFFAIIHRNLTEPTQIPTIGIERPSTTGLPALSTSLPTSFVISPGSSSSLPRQDVASSDLSGMTSTGSEVSSLSNVNVAQSNQPVYIKYKEDGTVEAANLPGLVERLILDSRDSRMDNQFQEIFLTTYQGFTKADAVFSLLLERFEAVSSPPYTVEQRVSVRYSVIAVLDMWLRRHHVEPKDVPLLHRMKQFALSVQNPTTLNRSASTLTQLIDKTVDLLQNPLSPLSAISASSSVRTLSKASGITPEIFAAALTEMESKRFKQIIPSDFVGWLKGIRESNGVSNFVAENNKISYWVQRYILKPDVQFQRAENLKFFLYVAQECQKRRSFSVACAIFAGLTSPSIAGLKRTSDLDTEERKVFQKIKSISSSEGNFKAYREELKAHEAPCLPYLVVHLRDLKSIHQAHPTFIEQDGHVDVINFDLYRRVFKEIHHILSYQHAPQNTPMSSGQLEAQDFIEGQLRSLVLNDIFQKTLRKRATQLAHDEMNDFVNHLGELKNTGFIR